SVDHSCSQFALLGLWISRRYGLKADTALRNAETRFRILQQPDGGWFYREGSEGKPGPTTLAMTCSGLMALAFGMSTRVKSEASFEGGKAGTTTSKDVPPTAPPPDPNKDAHVQKAREYLKQTVSRPEVGTPHLAYSLWAIERVCLIYNYRTIDKVD